MCFLHFCPLFKASDPLRVFSLRSTLKPAYLFAGVLMILWSISYPARAGSTDAACFDATRRAAAKHDIPLDILAAVALTETGMKQNGRYAPYPWSANVAGRGYRFESKRDAVASAEAWLKKGVTSFDVGCMQINWRWHGKAFSSVRAAFDPYRNTDYAARFLKSNYKALGSWPAAVGRYHSGTEKFAAIYRKKVAVNRKIALASLNLNPSSGLKFAALTFPKKKKKPALVSLDGVTPYKEIDKDGILNNTYKKGYGERSARNLPAAPEIFPHKREPAPGALINFTALKAPLLHLPAVPQSLISPESGTIYGTVKRHNGLE